MSWHILYLRNETSTFQFKTIQLQRRTSNPKNDWRVCLPSHIKQKIEDIWEFFIWVQFLERCARMAPWGHSRRDRWEARCVRLREFVRAHVNARVRLTMTIVLFARFGDQREFILDSTRCLDKISSTVYSSVSTITTSALLFIPHRV